MLELVASEPPSAKGATVVDEPSVEKAPDAHTVGGTHAPWASSLSVRVPVLCTQGPSPPSNLGENLYDGAVTPRSPSPVAVPVSPLIVMKLACPLATDERSTLDRRDTVSMLSSPVAAVDCVIFLTRKPGAYTMRAQASPSFSPSWMARPVVVCLKAAFCAMRPDASNWTSAHSVTSSRPFCRGSANTISEFLGMPPTVVWGSVILSLVMSASTVSTAVPVAWSHVNESLSIDWPPNQLRPAGDVSKASEGT
mmetsp:Transcript_38659/g.98824  ORF Transcript_38659/g.98824 Transcript_38659/m.98824 type:complete len:252 (+) Transcript_38659:274-1029(+)